MKDPLLSEHYDLYLDILKQLVSIPSVFSSSDDVEKALSFCKKIFDENLDDYEIYYDREGNLIVLPLILNPSEDLVYLSAHIDTVSADATEWDTPFHPWNVYEDSHELVGRGVNDCKAGVAYQLFLSLLAKRRKIRLHNLIFTITFKEEGAGNKSAKEIAHQLGKKLPLSEKSTYLFVLENNVRVSMPPVLCIYAAERSNYVIKTSGLIRNLQASVRKLSQWNPVSITPAEVPKNNIWEISKQSGGHVCSTTREENVLTRLILEAKENSVLRAGEENNFATLPTTLFTSESDHPIIHNLVLNNRSFDSLEDVLKQLDDIEYMPLKDFSISAGFNVENRFLNNQLSTIMRESEKQMDLKLEFTHNVGGSDASIIYGSMRPENRTNFYPIVMGPGSRSQKNAIPPRFTHGKNETFHKESGKRAVLYISYILKQLNSIY